MKSSDPTPATAKVLLTLDISAMQWEPAHYLAGLIVADAEKRLAEMHAKSGVGPISFEVIRSDKGKR